MLNYCSKGRTAFRKFDVTVVVSGAIIAATIITVQGAELSANWVIVTAHCVV